MDSAAIRSTVEATLPDGWYTEPEGTGVVAYTSGGPVIEVSRVTGGDAAVVVRDDGGSPARWSRRVSTPAELSGAVRDAVRQEARPRKRVNREVYDQLSGGRRADDWDFQGWL